MEVLRFKVLQLRGGTVALWPSPEAGKDASVGTVGRGRGSYLPHSSAVAEVASRAAQICAPIQEAETLASKGHHLTGPHPWNVGGK